jgi:hypothetical protein
MVHRNRSNLGGVTIVPGEVNYERAESTADMLLECAKHITDLGIFSRADAAKEVLVQKKQSSKNHWRGGLAKMQSTMINTSSGPALLQSLQVRG